MGREPPATVSTSWAEDEEGNVTRTNGGLNRLRASVTVIWVVLGVGAVMILMGGIFGAVAADSYRDGEETRRWTETTGEILSADVETEERRDRRSNGSMRTRTSYTPVVTYGYEVDGVAYTGHRIRADDVGGDRERAFDTINDYPVGSVTTVYYDPDNPGSAVLKQGADPVAVYLFGGVGGLFLVLGLAGVVGALVMRRRARPYPPGRAVAPVRAG
jgi:hypothetical protein